MIESLRQDYYSLRDENDRLREIVERELPKSAAEAILADCFDLSAGVGSGGNIDELAAKMPGLKVEDEEDDDDF